MLDALCVEPAAAGEGRPVSRAELAAALGISIGHLSRLLAAERAGRAPWMAPPPPPGEEPPHVPITDGPARGRYCYRLDDDGASRIPLGLMRIADGPAPIRDRTPSHPAAGPGRLEGRIGVHHFNEARGDDPHRKARKPRFKPKRPPKKKDIP